MFRRILVDAEFLAAGFHTRWLDEWLQQKQNKVWTAAPQAWQAANEDAVVLAAALYHFSQNGASSVPAPAASESRWKLEGRRELLEREPRK
jgi:hypothetical protein